MQIKVDPEFKSLIPPLSDDERAGLEADILRDGRATVPVVVWNGILLDGHNRLEICRYNKLPFDTQPAPEWITNRTDAKIWIRRTALNRRNLGPITRAELAAGLEQDLAAKAKAKQEATRIEHRQRDSAGRVKPEPVTQNSGEPGDSAERHQRETVRQAAAAAGMSHFTFTAARTVAAKGVPELKAAADRGEIAISTAAKLTELPPDRQRSIVADGKKSAVKAARAVQDERRDQRRAAAAEKAKETSKIIGNRVRHWKLRRSLQDCYSRPSPDA